MPTLKELLAAEPKRGQVLTDACSVLDQEVADKSGLSGIAIKTAYKVVGAIKPGFIREVVDHLLDPFLDALEPVVQEAVSKGAPVRAHFVQNADQVANALLKITDDRVSRSERPVIKKTYDQLRPKAQVHVAAAAPRLGALVERHIS
jgi:hypothetical protein